MTLYAAPQPGAVSTRVNPVPSRSAPLHAGQPPPNSASAATAVAHVPPSAVLSDAHPPPLQPNRHHPIPDNSWHDHHHTRLKASHISSSRIPPPSPSHPHLASHHPKVEKSSSPESTAIHHSHPTSRAHERLPHPREAVPETTHSYHTVNVVSPHPTGPRLTTPAPHASYIYPVHQLVAPVAHVPIGAAHYAHLPPSIWSPPHTQYHQHAHAQPHQIPPPSHHVGTAVVPAPHGQVQYATSHVHHVAPHTHASPHAYAIPPPYAPATPQHPPPPGAPHSVHPSSHHPQHHITYTYAQIPAPAPAHHPVKATVAVSPSQPLALGAPVSYTVPASHSTQPMSGPVSSKVTGKAEAVPVHVPHPEHVHTANLNGVVASGEPAKPYTVREIRAEPHRLAHGTEARTDTSPPALVKDPTRDGGHAKSLDKASEQRKDGSQKDKTLLQADQPVRKPRKPYTMKKSREVWTPEEHNRFLQALQLYDRDWKKIETYIGTKTVLQIRSHAQKYFGKVTKYKTGEYIPPPRPKKRAALPYPRSRTSGHSKSSSANGSGSDKPASDENSAHRAKDTKEPSANGRISATQHPLNGNQGSPELNGTTNGVIRGVTTDARDNHSKLQAPKPSQVKAVDVTERRTDPATYGDKYSPDSYDRQNNKRVDEFGKQADSPQTSSVPHWHPAPPPEQPPREHARVATLACASSTDVKPGINGYPNERYARQPQNSSYAEDLGQRERRYDREYHRGMRQAIVDSENNFASRQQDRPSPNLTSSTHSVEQNSRNEGPVRKNMAIPNNSLLVLSNCVDLMSRDAVPERQPAAGWATAAAARRAHRAKVIRARKPPLPQISTVTQPEDPGHRDKGSPEGHHHSTDIIDERTQRNLDGGVKSSSQPVGVQSPQVASPAEYGTAQPPPDPQRSSAGSGTGSDDAIAGFSSSDRPSVSGSAAGSGTGGSLDTSDAGDPEEDPKSSNDGSGDDGNRRSPPTRDSSPADPNSSGSRENSPNEFPLPEPRNEGGSVQLASGSHKTPEVNGMSVERFDGTSHAEKNSTQRKNSNLDLNGEPRENRHYSGRLMNGEKPMAGRDDQKSQAMPIAVHTAGHENHNPPLSRSTRADQESVMHERAVQEQSPNSRKRLRVTAEYDVHSRTDGIAEHDRESEPKRQRVRHSVKETTYTAEPAYHRHGYAEPNR